MRDLLHPPAHRGPLIAAGAVVLAIGVALEQVRIAPGAGVQFLVAGLLAATGLWLGLQGRHEGGTPAAHASVLIVIGLVSLFVALLQLADVLGADLDDSPGTFVWTGIVEAGVAAFAAVRRSSAIAALIAAAAATLAVLATWDWLFDPESVTPYRWLLLLMAIVFGIASLPMRGTSLRHAVQMVNAAGLAILAIALYEIVDSFFGAVSLPLFWEIVVLAAGMGSVAYAGADDAPGPAYIGFANLFAFVVIVGAGEDTLKWWPIVLLVVGGVMLGAGLRPREPLPPEPYASTSPDDLPLTVRVHRD